VPRKRQIGAAHGELEVDYTPTVDCFTGDYRDAEFGFQLIQLDLGAGGSGEIHHS
jgi:hypothetical protein